jgi:hypothetical protein
VGGSHREPLCCGRLSLLMGASSRSSCWNEFTGVFLDPDQYGSSSAALGRTLLSTGCPSPGRDA